MYVLLALLLPGSSSQLGLAELESTHLGCALIYLGYPTEKTALLGPTGLFLAVLNPIQVCLSAHSWARLCLALAAD